AAAPGRTVERESRAAEARFTAGRLARVHSSCRIIRTAITALASDVPVRAVAHRHDRPTVRRRGPRRGATKEPPMPARTVARLLLALVLAVPSLAAAAEAPQAHPTALRTYPMQEGFVDAAGVLIYYKTVGQGAPLLILHGGPGASHDYFLPYLLPLARHHKLVFIDERGSGRSQKLEDASRYTVEAMVGDVEAVRQALGLGKVDLLGHSFGSVLAEAYALAHGGNLRHLVLSSGFASTQEMNQVLARMKEKMAPELRERIDKMEAAGLYGQGKDYEKGRYTNDYMIAAWGEGYFPYIYQNRPDPTYDPTSQPTMAWDLYREMWGSHGEYVIDGNLKSVEYLDRLPSIHVPTLVTAGDHDESDPSMQREIVAKIPGAKLLILPKSGHMTFVDQPDLYISAVDEFLRGAEAARKAPAHPAPSGSARPPGR
ncbi:MAG TPA: proline iminopeptidase-family hydrolase, partial [Thermoanaerobaculia bacterium]